MRIVDDARISLLLNNAPVNLQDYMEDGTGEFYVKLNTSDFNYELRRDSVIEFEENTEMGGLEEGKKVYLALDASDSPTNYKDYFINAVDEQNRRIKLYENLAGVKVPLDNAEDLFTEFYEKLGSIYVYFDAIEGIDLYGNTSVDAVFDGIYKGKICVADGVVDLGGIDEYKYVVLGFAYEGTFETLPISGGSVLGSSAGSVGQIRNVLLSLYKSRGSAIGINNPPKPSSINYKGKDNPLFTGELNPNLANSGETWKRSVIVKAKGEPLNIRSVTLDCQVSDNYTQSTMIYTIHYDNTKSAASAGESNF